MLRRHSIFKAGFTLLEVILALLIVVIVMAVSIPSVTSALNGSQVQKTFASFDAMVQEAHERSVSERRNYVMVWGRDKIVRMRPEASTNQDEAEGIKRKDITKDEDLTLHLLAALTPKGEKPKAIWTFWASGVCEPARVEYRGPEGKWFATYGPFTIQPEVRYE